MVVADESPFGDFGDKAGLPYGPVANHNYFLRVVHLFSSPSRGDAKHKTSSIPTLPNGLLSIGKRPHCTIYYADQPRTTTLDPCTLRVTRFVSRGNDMLRRLTDSVRNLYLIVWGPQVRRLGWLAIPVQYV